MAETLESADFVYPTIEREIRALADRLDKASIVISNAIHRMEQSSNWQWKDCATELDREISPALDELTKISSGLR